MDMNIPQLSLVVLIGISGSGKSSFAKKHFKPTEVLSSDVCRALVSDDENNQAATQAAFEVLHYIGAQRLASGKLTVIDATNVQQEARKPLVELARKYHALPVAIVFDMPETICQARNQTRVDRDFGGHVIRQQSVQLRRSIRTLKHEGFRHIFRLTSEAEVNSATVERVPLWNDKKHERGPFDIIGDIHGCYDECIELLTQLGYKIISPNLDPVMQGPIYAHPAGRKVVFLGDFVDRGPKILETIRLVYNMTQAGQAFCVPGNHEIKLLRKLLGKNIQIVHGLAQSLNQIGVLPEDIQKHFCEKLIAFIDGLVSHYVFDEGKLVVAHAGLKQEMQGRGSGQVREFCLYGETTGETDEFGLPVRYPWAAEYRGPARVVYGHTPVPEAEWLNRTLNIDTGCVFGGKLTALRYPEKEIVSVAAQHTYCVPAKPFLPNRPSDGLNAQQQDDDVLDADAVMGKRFVTTRLRSTVTIREENAMAALEVMSRFAASPKWLIYLPPTLSPAETSQRADFLEYPDEAFAYFRSHGVPTVICEQKHMGSRAVVIVCKDEPSVARHFGVKEDGIGIVYTRTGRRFFNDRNLETQFLERIKQALDRSQFWAEFETCWVCLDCELMPWSHKAQDLLKTQYAAVGAAGIASLSAAIDALVLTSQRTDLKKGTDGPSETTSTDEIDISTLLTRFEARKQSIDQYIAAYRQYCWPVNSLDDLKLAPFHLLATEGKVHIHQDHEWHLKAIGKICRAEPQLLLETPYLITDVTDEASLSTATTWWEALTQKGGEGMVVKPFTFVAKGKKGLIQPALKCRGREYLRIIYGAEYTGKAHLERLRARSLGTKRSLALREFALGIEGLERFVRKEPLRRVHECVFGVLALESEPVDPRL